MIHIKSKKQFKSNTGLVLTSLIAAIIGSCGKIPSSIATTPQEGALEIRVGLEENQLRKESAARKIRVDTLVVEIEGEDMGRVRITRCPGSSFITDTLPRLPAGKSRTVRIYTIDKENHVIHIDPDGPRHIDITAGATVTLAAILTPVMGSIYLQIGDIPNAVDSVVATFVSDTLIRILRVKRSLKLNLTIDCIPHRTTGVLSVAGIDSIGDTLYYASTRLTIDARKSNEVPLQFESTPGGMVLAINLTPPASTLARGSMAPYSGASEEESGSLLITEIMYAVQDSEYIEIYNPGATSLFFDTLIIEIDGESKAVCNIEIDPGEAQVIGRKSLPWSDYTFSSSSFLNLSSLGGNWITLRAKNLDVIDRVVFTNSSAGLEWPVVTGKNSIELSGVNDALSNNFGSNWKQAVSLIEGPSSQYGTPGVR